MNILSIFQLANTNTTTIIFFALGGLGLFLFGLRIMSDSLKNLAGNKLKLLIKKTTGTTFKAILVGIAITVIIQSSSATTVIVVGLISAGLMTFTQGIGVMMGANIGTTITAFIIGLNISDYALPLIFIGSILCVFINRRKINISGEAILGFGILFFGLELMGTGLKELANKSFFENIIIALSNNWFFGVITGTLFTALIQSSSAFIGIIQKMFSTGTIPLEAVIPIIFGSNIGTTITALIASIGGNREAKQAAFSNLIIKIFGTVVFLIILGPFTKLFLYLQNAFFGDANMMIIAVIHLVFNIITTFITFFLVKYIVRFITRIIPNISKKDSQLISAYNLNYELLEKSPVLALESSRVSIIDMCEIALIMVKICKEYLNKNDDNYFLEIQDYENKMDLYDHLIHDYLMQLHSERLNNKESIYQTVYLDTIRDLERIGDHSLNLVEFFQDRYMNNITTDTETLENLNYFFDQIIVQVNNSMLAFSNYDVKIAQQIITLEQEIDTLERKYRRAQLANINKHDILNDIHYADILSNLERISDHCCNIAENVIDPYYMKKAITK